MATYSGGVKMGTREQIGAAVGGVLDPEAGLAGLASGATGGMVLGPAGAALGGALGFFSGAIGGQTAKVDAIMAEQAANNAAAKAEMTTDIDARSNARALNQAAPLGVGTMASSAVRNMNTGKPKVTGYDEWKSSVYGG